MTTSVPTPDEFITSFPESIPQRIIGRPDYAQLRALRKTLKINAASVYCPLGGGQHGYLAIVMTPATYATVSPVAFIPPVNPGIHPNIPVNATAAQRETIRKQHQEDTRLFKEHNNVQSALKKLIQTSVDDIYLRAISEAHIGFGNRSVLEMLTHLFQAYGALTQQQLHENVTITMAKAFNPADPFETIIDQLETCVEVAADGNQPIPPAMVLTTAYTLVNNSGQYYLDLERWDALPAVQRTTWNQFRTFMLEAQRRRLARPQAHMPNQASNMINQDELLERVQEIIVEHLPTKSLYYGSDSAPSGLTSTTGGTTPTTDNTSHTALTSQITELKQQLAALTASVQQGQVTCPPTGTGAQPPTKLKKLSYREKQDLKVDPNGYCWSHGYRCTSNHTSLNCKDKMAGHQDLATRQNPMGGSKNNIKGFGPTGTQWPIIEANRKAHGHT